MQAIIPGQANTVAHDLVKKADGEPITAGTVTFYLIALNGAHAGQWFQASDQTWSEVEAAAGAGVHKGGALWLCTIPAEAWSFGVQYIKYARESENRQVDYSEHLLPSLAIGAVGTGENRWTYTVTSSVDDVPISGVSVWVTTDGDGENIIYQDLTNSEGQVTFYLAAGTYYLWRQKSGYSFTNPDTEVVP